MSILPRCICDPYEMIAGRYDEDCVRHASVRKWLAERNENRPSPERYAELIKETMDDDFSIGHHNQSCRCGLPPTDCHPECPHRGSAADSGAKDAA